MPRARLRWPKPVRWLLLGCAAAVAGQVFVIARVQGESMRPTLRTGDYLLGLRVPHRGRWASRWLRNRLVRRGTIVLARPPAHLSRLNVKRVDAVAGDVRQWGWGEALTAPQPIPDEHVFLVGDGAWGAPVAPPAGIPAGPPADSRRYGPLPMEAVVARVVLRVGVPHPAGARERVSRRAAPGSGCRG